jgi:heat shock transcription factor
MYGFHKIPQLQQGVLKSDSDVEIWNFAHPHFRRGEPHLLNFIQRKRQAQGAQGDIAMERAAAGAGVIGTIDFHDATGGALCH